MVIKVLTSCRSNETPDEYSFSVNNIDYDKRGVMSFWPAKQLLETQTTKYIDSYLFNCDSQTIDQPCTLQSGLTWRGKK